MFNYYWISAFPAKAMRCSSSDEVLTTRMDRNGGKTDVVGIEIRELESNRWKSLRTPRWSQTGYGSGHSGVPEGSSIGSVSQSGRPPARLLYNVTQAANTLWNRDITATSRTALSKAHTCTKAADAAKCLTTEQMPGNTSSHVEHGGTRLTVMAVRPPNRNPNLNHNLTWSRILLKI